MIRKFILASSLAVIFTACGGGGGGGSTVNTGSSSSSITGVLLDSPISGVSYSCGSTSGTTNSLGQFTCVANTTVSFSIGGINLGSTTITSSKTNMTPAVLYGLASNDISDTKLTNFIQLVQSLDSDNNASNGIEITSTTRNNFVGYNLDLTNNALTQNDINTTVQRVGKTLVSKNNAIAHYSDTLKTKLEIDPSKDPYFTNQWYLVKNTSIYNQHNIHLNANITAGNYLDQYTGKSIKVAVLDSGLDASHEDLNGAVIKTYNTDTKGTTVTHTTISDTHGTAVSGIIAARQNGIGIQGIAPKVELIFIKFGLFISDSEIIDAFNKAEEFGADIINCSWGTSSVSTAVKQKIQSIATTGRNGKGTIIVFSSGNGNTAMGNDESAIPEVIAVGASGRNNLRTSYSDYGPNLDILAPGGEYIGVTTLDTTGNDGKNNTNYLLLDDSNGFVGTSASAPIISGAVALLLEKDPTLTRVQVEAKLKTAVDKIGTIPYVNGRNDYYGYGKINLTKLLSN